MRELSTKEIEEVSGGYFWGNLFTGIVSGLVVDAMQNGRNSVLGQTGSYITNQVYVSTGCYSNF